MVPIPATAFPVYRLDDQLLLSATDLVNFLECEHLSHIDLKIANGALELEPTRIDTADLLAQKGDEHEAAWLAHLKAAGAEVVEITDPRQGLEGLLEAVEQTTTAMQAGAEVIYQAALMSGRW